VPITAMMVAVLEMSGIAAWRVHLLMAALLLSRLMHPLGMYAKPMTLPFRIFRTGGMGLTIALLIVCAVMILLRLWRGGSGARKAQQREIVLILAQYVA
jgi:hypothetical protein